MITAWQVGKAQMTVGDFVLVNTFMLQLYTPLNFLGTSYRMIKQSLIDMEQLFDLLREKPDIIDPERPLPCDITTGEVVFEDVHFAYKDQDVLKGVSFKILPGKQLAIVCHFIIFCLHVLGWSFWVWKINNYQTSVPLL